MTSIHITSAVIPLAKTSHMAKPIPGVGKTLSLVWWEALKITWKKLCPYNSPSEKEWKIGNINPVYHETIVSDKKNIRFIIAIHPGVGGADTVGFRIGNLRLGKVHEISL